MPKDGVLQQLSPVWRIGFEGIARGSDCYSVSGSVPENLWKVPVFPERQCDVGTLSDLFCPIPAMGSRQVTTSLCSLVFSSASRSEDSNPSIWHGWTVRNVQRSQVLVRYSLSVTVDEIVWLTLTQEYEPQENKELAVFVLFIIVIVPIKAC